MPTATISCRALTSLRNASHSGLRESARGPRGFERADDRRDFAVEGEGIATHDSRIDANHVAARRLQPRRRGAVAAARVEYGFAWRRRQQCDHRQAEVGHESRAPAARRVVIALGPAASCMIFEMQASGPSCVPVRLAGHRRLGDPAVAGPRVLGVLTNSGSSAIGRAELGKCGYGCTATGVILSVDIMSSQGRATMQHTILLAACFGLTAACSASAASLKVPADHPTVQSAINAWQKGDVIWVAQGTYTENLVLKPGVRLEGGFKSDYSARNWTAWPSVIDGAQKGSVVIGAAGATLDGFTLRNGQAAQGGGIFLERGTMTIRNNTIEDNVADRGGGVYVAFNPAAPPYTDIEANIIRRNRARAPTGQGGGILVTNSQAGVRISRNTIGGNMGDGNTALAGGGIAVEFTAVFQIEENTISQNLADGFHGGGLMITDGTPNATVSRNVISYNTATGNFGGGIYSIGGTYISRNDIRSNTLPNTISSGGGLVIDSPGGTPPRVENNFVHGNIANLGGGIYIHRGQNVILMNNSVRANQRDAPQAGAGVYVRSGATCILQNNILWANGDDFHEQSPGACTLSHNDIEDGDQAGQDGNIQGDPKFVAYDDLHIQKGSPAINAGRSAAAPLDDYDGDKRGTSVDIGADEIIVEGGGGGPCPLVKSAHASYLEPHLGAVREFRNEWLESSSGGRALVRMYYAKAPVASAFLDQHDWARHATRWIVTPLVLAIEYPGAAILASLVLALMLVYWRVRVQRPSGG